MTIEQIANYIRNEASKLDTEQLRKYALEMGVERDVVHRGTRSEIIDTCIAIEQHTFAH